MNKCRIYTIIMLLSFLGNVESGFSQTENHKVGEVITVCIDSLPSFEKRIEQTNVQFNIPSGFTLCKRDSIRIEDCIFRYMPSFPHLRPGIIQSKDMNVLILLITPYISIGYDSIKALKTRNNRLSNDERWRILKKTHSAEIKVYPSKMAKTYFNADSMFVWRQTPERTNILFVADTVDVTNKMMQRLDKGYNIKDELFWKYYPYSKTMIIKKKDVGYIPVYIYFTEQGLRREEKYIRDLKKLFWFQ